jgi:membrane-bound lytic murein transglycosylase A
LRIKGLIKKALKVEVGIFGLAFVNILWACAPLPNPKLVLSEAPVSVLDLPQAVPLRSADLPGFDKLDTQQTLAALKASCAYKAREKKLEFCDALKRNRLNSAQAVGEFIDAHFDYYVPEFQASEVKDEVFSAVLRPRPLDLVLTDGANIEPPMSGPKVAARLVDGRYMTYSDRATIEAKDTDALAYMRPEDLFFMQIQGSGYVSFPDGRRMLAVYAADNGHTFKAIARPMVEQGIFTKDQASGDAIHAWLAANRGEKAQAMMNLNPRYVFFTLMPQSDAPLGAAGVPLPAGAAAAIDPAHYGYGELLWIDGDTGYLGGQFPAYQRLVAALDTGGAIKGPIRADLFIGHGAKAGTEAGRIRHKLRLWKLIPKSQ